jgi:2-hydroxychromene-2-carboxylate isomerase
VPAALPFYFDFISPYAYVAWTQMHALAARHDRDVTPIPVLFAALLDRYGTKGPAEIPPKRVYIWKDILRTARVLGVPLTPPPAHPFNPLLALRAVSAIDDPAEKKRAIEALFAATWGGGEAGHHGVTEPATVAAALTSAGLDGPAIVAETNDAAIKARVREQTEAALARGVFGVPTFFVDDEPFWGVDSFAHAERCLRGADPIAGVDLSVWAELPAQAHRTPR